MSEIGDRVGAIQSAKNNEVKFFGYGIYKGREIPPQNIGGLNIGIPNPKIELDDGTIVWGCECWWGSEEKVKKIIGDRNIVIVKPER